MTNTPIIRVYKCDNKSAFQISWDKEQTIRPIDVATVCVTLIRSVIDACAPEHREQCEALILNDININFEGEETIKTANLNEKGDL